LYISIHFQSSPHLRDGVWRVEMELEIVKVWGASIFKP